MLQAPVCEKIKDELNERRIAQLEGQLAKKDAQLAEKDAQIVQLIREVRELKAEQNKRDEEFSTALEAVKHEQFHKPPSQYPPYEKEKKKPRLRIPAQKGKRSNKKFRVDKTFDQFVTVCAHCGALLSKDKQTCTGSYPQIELEGEKFGSSNTLVKTYVANCSNCGKVSHTAKRKLKNSCAGPRLATEIVHLSIRHRLPMRRISESLLETYGVELSPAAISKVLKSVALELSSSREESLAKLRKQPYIHCDETSYTYLANGERKVAWVWVLASQDTIYYELALSRGAQVLEKLIPDPGGMIAVVDGWQVYRKQFSIIQRCWAHILREGKVRGKRGDDGSKLLHEQLQNFYLRVKQTRQLGKGGKKLAELMREQFVSMLAEAEASDWVSKLSRASGDLFRCVEFLAVPMDNNYAERSLRELVIHRKIKGHLSTDTLTILLGFSATCQLEGKNFQEEVQKMLTE